MKRGTSISMWPVQGLPMIRPGDNLATLVARAVRRSRRTILARDVLVVAQKAVSKAEGRTVVLADVVPGAKARELAGVTGKDPHLVEVILTDARRVVRSSPGVLIVETHHGFVCANGGVDQSNAAPGVAVRLPVDPDASAERIREGLAAEFGHAPAVIVSDSHGRPWRVGSVGIALGAAGIAPLTDLRGSADLVGRTLHATVIATVDEVAAAASLVMGEADEGIPAAVVRGVAYEVGQGGVRAMLRRPERDLFR
jgi:coenzyme F420-0:L-glutamate ligase/coenzyme F420-1:gamma-L-glutamate ligase